MGKGSKGIWAKYILTVFTTRLRIFWSLPSLCDLSSPGWNQKTPISRFLAACDLGFTNQLYPRVTAGEEAASGDTDFLLWTWHSVLWIQQGRASGVHSWGSLTLIGSGHGVFRSGLHGVVVPCFWLPSFRACSQISKWPMDHPISFNKFLHELGRAEVVAWS